MKSVISTTYDDKYLYFLPIVTWLWNKLNVDVICFMPSGRSTIKKNGGVLQGVYPDGNQRMYLINETIKKNNNNLTIRCFNASEHKEATYSQCSRLYGACLDLPEDEVLVLSDIDMALFKNPVPMFGNSTDELFKIFGADLVPENQYPICYISAPVKKWRKAFNTDGFTYQQCLDNLLGDIECENMRGNYWSKDQQTAHEVISSFNEIKVGLNRARLNTQFADHRVDRDDQNWRAYVNDDLIDAHLWRPGYTDENHANIMELIRMKFPNDDFQWLIDYTQKYKELL